MVASLNKTLYYIVKTNFTHALLLLSHFSGVRLCATPKMAAHQAPPSLGFSRQEHWSGLPFPSPMHESEKWKWSLSALSDASRPHGLQPTRLLHPWGFPGKRTGVGCHCLLRSPCSENHHILSFPASQPNRSFCQWAPSHHPAATLNQWELNQV